MTVSQTDLPGCERAAPALAMRGIIKRFGALTAVDQVDFEVMPGTVHALLGENGAGKTTLMNCLFGLETADAGQILIDGHPTRITSPRDAQAVGIGMVHQHFKLVPSLTVAENIFLGRERTRLGLLARGAANADVEKLARNYGIAVDPRAVVRTLSVGAQQRVEILRALSQNATILVLDEPTAVLTPAEAEQLYEIVRGFAARGLAVVLISHHLDEVLDVADHVTVLRQGRLVARRAIQEVDAASLARFIVGSQREELSDVPYGVPGKEVLRVEQLEVLDRFGKKVVDDVSLAVRAGEIVGLLGISGNGQTELGEAITGLRRLAGGSVHLGATRIDSSSTITVGMLRQAGMAHIPEDRIGRGMCGLWSVENNIAVGFLDEFDGRLIQQTAKRSLVARLLAGFDVRVASGRQLARRLSGGNAQKLVLARELSLHPSVLVCSEPTRGLDVAATDFVRRALVERRDAGVGVLLVSSDLREVLQMSDRVLVILKGRIVAEFAGRPSKNDVGRAMLGDVS